MLNPIINKTVNYTFTANTTQLVQIDYKQGGQNTKTDKNIIIFKLVYAFLKI